MAKKETAENPANNLDENSNETAENPEVIRSDKKFFAIKPKANYSAKSLDKSFVKNKTVVSTDIDVVNFCKTNGYFTVTEVSEEEAKNINRPVANNRRKRIQ